MTNLIDNQGIHAGERHIPWSDVREVAVRTTSDGPFAEDLFWMFDVADGLVELPGSLVNGDAVGAMQEALPHLDNLKLIVAMGSTSERIFSVWRAERPPFCEPAYRARFAALIARLGGGASADVFTRLVAAWSAPDRRYHNLEHLTDCLAELDAARVSGPVADIAELALWYHDAVYAPAASDNEERSAALLLDDARALGISEAAGAAAACVRATAHRGGALAVGSAAELVVDVDLTILGREPLRFMDYEYAIAEEYAGVPWRRYRFGRGRFLRELLACPTIFRTPFFAARYEQQARRNLASLLASPRYRQGGLLGWFQRLLA